MCILKRKQTTATAWKNDRVFEMLCDFVAEGHLVCLTGSGISRGLKLKNEKVSPDWNELLRELTQAQTIKDKLTEQQQKNLIDLLVDNAPGENLIEASSILFQADKDAFLDTLSSSVDLKEGETSQIHQKLLDLHPKGILTYNYDVAHENAIKANNAEDKWCTVIPEDNDKIVEILKNKFEKNFLFKMHGSVKEKLSMVLTRESYRNLFIKYPYYKAFVQQIFTNYHLLIVGFRMSDPDFDMLLQNVFSTFGSPVQEHIVIKHINEKSPKDIVYTLRYGLNFLYIDDFSDIPDILQASTKTQGTIIKNILRNCVDTEISVRGKTHAEVRALSTAGKKCLAGVLENIIKKNIALEDTEGYNLNTETSEYVYTYGVLAVSTKEKHQKDFLIHEVMEKSKFSEPIAHALVHLRDILSLSDLEKVEEWKSKFKNPLFNTDRKNLDENNRVYKYCEAIYYLLLAKHKDVNNC